MAMGDLAREDTYSSEDDDRRRFAEVLANLPSSTPLSDPFEAAAARVQARYANRNRADVLRPEQGPPMPADILRPEQGPPMRISNPDDPFEAAAFRQRARYANRNQAAPDATGAVEHLAKYLAGPGRAMQGNTYDPPGTLSEEGSYLQDANRQAATDWAIKTGFGMVFDPIPAAVTLARGLPLRGASSMGAGAGQGGPGKPANQNIQSVESLADAVQRRLADNPAAAKMAEEPFLRPLDQARLAATQAKSDQGMREQLFKLGPNPTREEFEKWVLRKIDEPGGFTVGSSAGGGSDKDAALRLARMGALAEQPVAPPSGIRAYHSSPYDFERFDASKIGTGEGAQVYGHGIY